MSLTKQRTVLVVAPTGDAHADRALAALNALGSVDAARISLAEFPTLARASFELGAGQRRIYESHGQTIDLESVVAVWWRRPNLCDLPQVYYGIDRTFVRAECEHYITGLLWSLDCLWINSPTHEIAASRKLRQLTLASKLGLRVPRTLVTNDPSIAIDFAEQLGLNVVFKRVGTSPGPFCRTTRLTREWLPKLATITTCPTIFQEYIAPAVDYRVVWLDGRIWAFHADTSHSTSPEDTRLDSALPCKIVELDHDTSVRLSAFMRELGLLFGVLDLRLGDDGQIYFFELNPSGQFAYLEETGVPLIQPLAARLARGK